MNNKKCLIISIVIPILIGIIGNLLGNSSMGFEVINKPSFSPPAIVFPIVWTILYILMGISSYIIYNSKNSNKNEALVIYTMQLVINMLWPLFFFNLRWYFFSFIWIILLIALVAMMIHKFIKINKTAGYIQIPYLIWLIFASILNFSIYMLN